MIIDNNLALSAAQVLTVTAPSSNIIDQLAAGDAMGGAPYLQFLVNTAFTAGGAATLTIALQDSADGTTFADVSVSGAIAVASLIAGYVAWQIQLPPMKLRRYLRGNYTIATGPMTAGKIDARMVLQVDKTLDRLL